MVDNTFCKNQHKISNNDSVHNNIKNGVLSRTLNGIQWWDFSSGVLVGEDEVISLLPLLPDPFRLEVVADINIFEIK